jgi:hypothetical protein
MKMGDMEMIDEHGVKATFKDDGVHLDIVPLSQSICGLGIRMPSPRGQVVKGVTS